MSYDEIQELACLMLGKDYESIVNSYDENIIDKSIYEEYGIDMDNFYKIIEDLIKFTPSWQSPLTGELYQGFVVPEGDLGLMRAVIKEKVK